VDYVNCLFFCELQMLGNDQDRALLQVLHLNVNGCNNTSAACWCLLNELQVGVYEAAVICDPVPKSSIRACRMVSMVCLLLLLSKP
jgi:hypothetical protein